MSKVQPTTSVKGTASLGEKQAATETFPQARPGHLWIRNRGILELKSTDFRGSRVARAVTTSCNEPLIKEQGKCDRADRLNHCTAQSCRNHTYSFNVLRHWTNLPPHLERAIRLMC